MIEKTRAERKAEETVCPSKHHFNVGLHSAHSARSARYVACAIALLVEN